VKSSKLNAVRRVARKRSRRRREREQETNIQPNAPTPAIVHLQRQIGNQAVNDLIASRFIQRQAENSNDEEALDNIPLNTAGLEREGRLAGHGNLGGLLRSVLPRVQRNGGGSSPITTNMNLTLNSPIELPFPASYIASTHGRPGVAGWTTPIYNINVPRAYPYSVDIDVTMNYDMELATEYTGNALEVLRDHEFGHVSIGNQKAQQYLIDNLSSSLRSLPRLNLTNLQAAINAAANSFVAAEGQSSQAYDNMDYPRMRQAYIGAQMSLADLETDSENIADMGFAVRNFNALAASASEERISELAQAVLDARDGLSEDEVARLQYNTDFRNIVAICRNRIEHINQRFHWDLWIVEFSTMDQAVRRKLDDLSFTLNDFTWQSPV